jgi:hypothetical protein
MDAKGEVGDVGLEGDVGDVGMTVTMSSESQ